MKLYDVLKTKESEEEIVVIDNDIDMECYFYNNEENEFDLLMLEIAQLVDVIDVNEEYVIVDFYTLIENNYNKIMQNRLYAIDTDIEDIVESLNNVFSGYVSISWLNKFVDCLQ